MFRLILFLPVSAFVAMCTFSGLAQVCTPDPQFTDPGVYPDTITNLPPASVGCFYEVVLTIVVPTDTSDPQCCSVTIDSITLDSISNLPPGLTYQCDNPSCTWAGGAKGCILISGTPTTANTYPLNAYSTSAVTCKANICFCCNINATVGDNGPGYTIDVSSPVALFVSAAATSDYNGFHVSCSDTCNGTAEVTVSGGITPYSYLWSNGQNTSQAQNLCAGNNSVTVTDNCGATEVDSISLSSPTALSLSVLSNNASCSTNCNGTAIASASGGVTPYYYLWSDGQTTDTASGLCVGTYSVTVTDTNGCTATTSGSVGIISQISLSISTTNANCGNADGSATITATGGITPYSYLWSNSQTTSTATGLAAGTYTITVTDSLTCTGTATASVSNISAPSLSVASLTPPGCFGGNNGSAAVAATGGSGPYTFTWGTTLVQTGATATGLAAGSYLATVADSLNCSSTITVTVTEPILLTIALTGTNVKCAGNNNGSITTVATGGTSPYSYLWSTGAVTSSASGLAGGSYSVTITDSKGCTDADTVLISEPTALVLPVPTTTNATCALADGSATINPSGGTPPYSYLWSNGSTTSTDTGLSAGIYGVLVSDTKGCQDSATATVNATETMTAAVTGSSNLTCYELCNGSASASGSAGTAPYSYQWSTTPVQTGDTAINLCTGTYIVTVIDARGCIDTTSVTIGQPSPLTATVTVTDETVSGASNGTASVTASGGTPPYTYLWSTAETTTSIDSLFPGLYTVTVADANGCGTIHSGSVTGVSGLDGHWAAYDNIRLYPVPAKDFLIMETSATLPALFEMYDLLAKPALIVELNKSVTVISTAGLPEGLYFFVVKEIQNGKSARGKLNIIKTHGKE